MEHYGWEAETTPDEGEQEDSLIITFQPGVSLFDLVLAIGGFKLRKIHEHS